MKVALGTVLLWLIGTGRATPTEAEIAPLGWAGKMIEVKAHRPHYTHTVHLSGQPAARICTTAGARAALGFQPAPPPTHAHTARPCLASLQTAYGPLACHHSLCPTYAPLLALL